MISRRFGSRFAFALSALALVAFAASPAWAKGGGHGGGGHHGGGHHSGGHHGGHHANHHPYHPSSHHHEHHSDHHHSGHHDHHHTAHHDHHSNHHHSSWHNGGWGPGFWGGAALGYGLGYGYNWAPWGGYGYGGGDTYVDNSTDVTPASNDAGDDDSDDSAASDDDSSDNQSAPNTAGSKGFPTDDWPELGITTYAGQYGGSQGQVIVRIVPNSAAAKAGLVPGDVILSLNGQPTPSADSLDQILDSANGKFTAEVWDVRTGRNSTVSGQLDPNAPAEDDKAGTTASISQQ